jgi:hypothetical protein
MKKPSLAFNPAAIGQFFLVHGEKLGLAVVGGFSLLMLWWGLDALRSQAVDQARSPQALSELARAAESNIDAVQRVPPERLPRRQPLAPTLDPWRPQQVKIADPPENRALFSRPLVAELTKRTKPDVFPIEDLRAVAGIAVLPDPNASLVADEFALRRPGPVPEPPAEEPRRRPGRGQPRERDRERAGEGGLFGLEGGLGEEPQALAAEPQPAGVITPFVIVTGLIPAARQRAEFETRFASAGFQDPERDTPRWAVYLVERARVVPGGGLNWKKMEVKNVDRAEAGGRIGMAEMPIRPGEPAPTPLEAERLPQAFLLQADETEIGYAAPLPERIDEPWGVAAMHPWFEPRLQKFLENPELAGGEMKPAATVALGELLANARGRAGEELRLEGVVLGASPERQREARLSAFAIRSAEGDAKAAIGTIGLSREPVFAISDEWASRLAIDGTTTADLPCNLRVRVDSVGRTPVVRILMMELRDEAGAVADTLMEPQPEPIEGGEGLGPMAGPLRGDGGFGPQDIRAENRLFRFVDMAVKPGETYRYRVKLALRNPNFDLAPQHLADPGSSKARFLASDYSTETPPVRVPSDTLLLARTITKDTARAMKVKGDALEVMVLGRSEKTGNFALRSTVTDLGGLVNVDPALNRAGDTRFFGEKAVTDEVLVDARGPQADRADIRSTDPPEPLEMLFLSRDGSFQSVTAADSEAKIRRYGSTFFKPGTQLPADGRADSGTRE